jgi:hypothetical protein
MRHIAAGEAVPGPWVLVVAGVTPLGRRQAIRAVTSAIREGRNVLVLDGQVPGLGVEDLPDTVGPEVLVYAFGASEREGLAARLTEPVGRPRGRVWRVLGRRFGTVMRPLGVWSKAGSAIRPLANGPAPERIVCCDEASITTAWKSSRIWPGTPVGAG